MGLTHQCSPHSTDNPAKVKSTRDMGKPMPRQVFLSMDNTHPSENERSGRISPNNPFAALSRRDLKHYVVNNLSSDERLIVVLYYYESMSMREIGCVLDLSESRVSQMYTSVLLRLRAQMRNRVAT